MPVQAACPSCSVKLQVKDDLIGKQVRCPKCGGTFQPTNTAPELSATGDWQKPKEPETLSLASPDAAGTVSHHSPDGQVQAEPNQPPAGVPVIGRYRVEKILGEGGFGVVYLAHDDELKRRVALKVPQAHRIRTPKDAEAYLVEAQVLAKLDHPHIVPVYDVGRSGDGLPYVVSKFIEGCSLADRIKQSRLAVRESVVLVAKMADALQYAHQHRLVHRDVKPGNILLDTSNKPFLVDFGLALKEEDFGKGGGILGTPAYMSPEQANGEGHLVDGRSDIFSLGVVLYELLAGQRPFSGDTIDLILFQITTLEPRPPRQIDPAVPKELERITLKALAKKASERYPTALDLADDLNHWLEPKTTAEKGPASLKIIPKGLRSFDANDADFFLELLPGPRDRDGLPDTLRFWKNRIEETVAEQTFRVGVIYGPSGCGKSSFVKAGLLPRLANTVRVVYIEATPDDTEARLLKGIQKACPELPDTLTLREAVAYLRRQDRPRHKLVLVLDQFEQWLHGKQNQENTELVQALRQCDGERVQAIIMVRDDFGMALTRFMRELEIRLVEGENFATVDLFDLRHAKKILTAFGRAYGTLAEDGIPTKEQEAFLDQVVSGLSQEGKVISVRLALFAEMVKGKPWTPATLHEIGGTEGVGVTFLEETFSASSTPPQHRFHQNAVRAVLRALLPESDSDIRGRMRSQSALLQASGYGTRLPMVQLDSLTVNERIQLLEQSWPKEFRDLIQILDQELRLITPTDPEGKDPAELIGTPLLAHERYYQLTHDFLVPSLRDWLTRKQKETRRGRAELLLADRAAVWNARPENRQLPSLLQWMQIRWWTQKRTWTPAQKKMMGKASRYHAVRTGIVAMLLAVATFTGLAIRDQATRQKKEAEAAALVQRLLDADTENLLIILHDMDADRRWTNPLLQKLHQDDKLDPRYKLRVALALLPSDPTQVDYLYRQLLFAQPKELRVIRFALKEHRHTLIDRLWSDLLSPDAAEVDERIPCAASALAEYAPNDPRWDKASEKVAQNLAGWHWFILNEWMGLLRPIRGKLTPPLVRLYRNKENNRYDPERIQSIITDYAYDQPDLLADLLMDADFKQFDGLFQVLSTHGHGALPLLLGEIDKTLPADLPSSDGKRETLAKRQVNAAVALLRLNQPAKVWPLLKHSPDPRVRSYLIHRLSPLGADARAIVKRLDEETDLTIRRALLLSLGEFKETDFTPDERKAVLPKLQEVYRTVSDPGLHAASEWLLRTWKQEPWLTQVNDEWAKDGAGRDKRIAGIKELVTKDKEKTPPQWYVNTQGQTMVVIPGPVEFQMGSPTSEPDRRADEVQHKRKISRSFAILAKPVTLGQYRSLTGAKYEIGEKYTYDSNLPVVGVSWYMAAQYCNLLSKEEGIPEDQWCYDITGKAPDYDGTRLKKNYLSLIGYRLPTEAEMEYVTRAGSTTCRYFGETEELQTNYAWFAKNANDVLKPVGQKKPNDLGLFDVHGNCFTWCQGAYVKYPASNDDRVEDQEGELVVLRTEGRMLRGGSFSTQSFAIRSAYRANLVPTTPITFAGIRPARTILP